MIKTQQPKVNKHQIKTNAAEILAQVDERGSNWISKAVITVFPRSLVSHSVSSSLKWGSAWRWGAEGGPILYDPGWTSSWKQTWPWYVRPVFLSLYFTGGLRWWLPTYFRVGENSNCGASLSSSLDLGLASFCSNPSSPEIICNWMINYHA